ncbi:hypothetical protein [Chitinophaga sp. CB10]|uniref:hypothetical protein n=1 Tax=Chitinophaga sp. CB10 TaxID=1891659 RepID=UPI0025BB15DA|nr:hypothetical protein [Chitinophaga sp. CB10]
MRDSEIVHPQSISTVCIQNHKASSSCLLIKHKEASARVCREPDRLVSIETYVGSPQD